MILTQVELQSTDDERQVYWLNTETYPPLKIGRGVKIKETPHFWKINRVFITLKEEDLPAKAKVGTIVELN